MPETPYTVYRQSSRRRWPYVVLAAACAAAALLSWQLLAAPRVSAVTPAPETYVSERSLMVTLDVHGLQKLENLRVALDGRDITDRATLHADRLVFTTGELADGHHSVSFSASSSNLLRRSVSEHWRFTVDTVVPTLTIAGKADKGLINSAPATFEGTTEALSTVTVASGSIKAAGQADAHGDYAVSVMLPDGPSAVTITTTDRAGNSAARRLDVYVDSVPPLLETTRIAKTVRRARLKIHVRATDQLGTPVVRATLDGDRRAISGPVADATLSLKGLAEGSHVLRVSASDRGGNVVTEKHAFVVDSTEKFGWAPMGPGARGKDVKDLQRRLAKAGVYSGKPTGVYDRATTSAVRQLQAKYAMAVDGLVGDHVLAVLSGQIVVDIGDLRLYLYNNGRLVKSYRVATGQAAYPTPTGSYSIVSMQKDPTWLPPNSDWAKEAKPIPPGVENPLGTRWMGTSAPGIGIHGVPPSEDASIGTYASHGCIRMHNWDAIDLFDRIVIGMPVVIRL